jgi:CDGSH-type Zn-finger protein
MKITIIENGPALIETAPFTDEIIYLKSGEKVEEKKDKVYLCRCGKTKNQIGMCDGSHKN